MLSWDADGLAEVAAFARAHGTTSLLIAHPDRVVLDENWPLPPDVVVPPALRVETLDDGRAREDVASAQKSITSVLVGVALGRSLLELDVSVSAYLGGGWTHASIRDERLITVRHLLTMTSGLDDSMHVVAEPGARWDYNLGAGYHTLKRVLCAVAGEELGPLTAAWLLEPLGMTETEWSERPLPTTLEEPVRSMVCYPDGRPLEGLTTTARDLARFGLAVLGGPDALGVPDSYLRESLSPSSALNPAYGYLWWLNGQPWQLAPKRPEPIDGWLLPDAPRDLVAALGALGRAIYVVPSADLVVVRLGVDPGPVQAAGTPFGRDLWTRIRAAASGWPDESTEDT